MSIENPSLEELYKRIDGLPEKETVSEIEIEKPKLPDKIKERKGNAKKAAVYTLAGVVGSGAMAGAASEAWSAEKIEQGIKYPGGHVEVKEIKKEQLASKALEDIANNPSQAEEIVKEFAGFIREGESVVDKDISNALKELNIASSKLSPEDLKKMGNLIPILIKLQGKYESINKFESSDLEKARKFVEDTKNIPDNKDAKSPGENKLMKRGVVNQALMRSLNDGKAVNALKCVLEGEESGKNDLIDYLKIRLGVKL